MFLLGMEDSILSIIIFKQLLMDLLIILLMLYYVMLQRLNLIRFYMALNLMLYRLNFHLQDYILLLLLS